MQPLTLPAADAYGPWLAAQEEEHLARASALAEELRESPPASAAEVLRLWDDIALALGRVFAPASLVANVHPDAGVRSEAEGLEQRAMRVLTGLMLDPALHRVLADLDPAGLDQQARRVLDLALRDFRRSGVDRDEETRERVRALSDQQTELSQQFSRQIRDGVGRLRVEATRLAGLPDDFLASHPEDDDGTVELTTEYPDYVPVMTFAEDRELREAMVRLFLNRAWPENDVTLRALLESRRELAELLGYPDWPTYDAEVKMIGTGAAIGEFIDELAELAAEPGRRDLAVLLDRVRQDRPEAEGLDVVDRAYYSELLRRERHEVDAREVRGYFDFAKVRAGLLAVTGRLFDLTYVEVPDAPRWHEAVTAYDVTLGHGDDARPLGRIYLDLHPRPGKYSHAAQFTLVTGVDGVQVPEGVLVCNFPDGLMEHSDVVTLFHEFGHLVHHQLASRSPWSRFGGISTEWDFVEAPSQMLEEWAWDPAVLAGFATDAEGRPIPADLVGRMRAAAEFGKGYHVRTQLFYAAVSYVLHRDVPEDLTATVQELQARYDLFGTVPDTHFQASFGHLGGYTSGYYTYLWSQVIAKDLFSAFDRDDLFAEGVAHRYRDRVLAAGGTRDAAALVEDFLGRPYGAEAFQAWLRGD